MRPAIRRGDLISRRRINWQNRDAQDTFDHSNKLEFGMMKSFDSDKVTDRRQGAVIQLPGSWG